MPAEVVQHHRQEDVERAAGAELVTAAAEQPLGLGVASERPVRAPEPEQCSLQIVALEAELEGSLVERDRGRFETRRVERPGGLVLRHGVVGPLGHECEQRLPGRFKLACLAELHRRGEPLVHKSIVRGSDVIGGMATMSDAVLGQRALNRALLERHLLLSRVEASVPEVVEHLLGLQAQASMPPYYALWSRLEGFDPNELGRMLTDGEVVRLTLMRGTVHLVTVRDALLLRPLVQVVVERAHRGVFGRRMGAADLSELAAAVNQLLSEAPLTARDLGRRLVERGIGDDAEAIGNAARVYLPLVQLPPRGVWGAGGQAKYATIESWTGRELEVEPSLDDLVLRYLKAFGPASVMDVQNWSGLTKLKAVLDRLRPGLVTFRDQHGKELFDLPDAPRPDPDVQAPVRFLGEYDNVLLGHADRRRIIPADFPWDAMLAHARFVSNLLVDGMLRATWWIERGGKRRATLGIRPFGKLSRVEREHVAAEAERMIDFAASDAEIRAVRFEAPVT